MRRIMLVATLFGVLLSCSPDNLTDVRQSESALHSRFFVAVGGSETGDGTWTHPWTLATALAHPGIVQPGDTIWLRGGTYRGDFSSKLTGTAAAPVVLRQYPGERATIDGDLHISGNYAYYWGFEVMYSGLDRESAEPGSNPGDLPRAAKGIAVDGSFNKLINLVVHDLGGNFAGVLADGLEVYGSLFYNNGWMSSADGPHGQHLYLQNQTSTKSVIDNVMFGSYSHALQIYSSTAQLRKFHVEGNAIFGSGDPANGNDENIVSFGGENGLYHGPMTIRANSVYHREPAWISVYLSNFYNPGGSDILFEDNIVKGQSFFFHLSNWTIRRNKLAGEDRVLLLQMKSGQAFAAHAIHNNAYASMMANPFDLRLPAVSTYSFTGWNTTTGYDLNGTFVSQFTGADIVYRPNSYERGRGFIHCWNWDGAASLNVDPSKVGLAVGDRFEIHHVYDILGAPVASGVYAGGTVSLGQTGYVPPAPIGDTAPPSASPKFNVFLVRKQ